jgi:general secretion pathway protein B
MSYILDALRKSDQLRHRGAAPTLLTAHTAPAPAAAPAYWLLGLLAAVLLGAGILIGWLRPWHADSAQTVVLPAPEAASNAREMENARARAQAEAMRKVEQELAAQKAVSVPRATAPLNVQPQSLPATAQSAPPASAAAQPAAPPTAAPAKIQGKVVVPTTVAIGAKDIAAAPASAPLPAPTPVSAEPAVVAYSELPFQIQQEVPRLTIAVHAYSKEPKSRLVTIDNRLLHEGDEAAPGLRIEQITPDGMIFSFKGYRFRRSVRDFVNNR